MVKAPKELMDMLANHTRNSYGFVLKEGGVIDAIDKESFESALKDFKKKKSKKSRKNIPVEELGEGILLDSWVAVQRFFGSKHPFAGMKDMENLLKEHGNAFVTSITMFREPIQAVLKLALNAATLGKFNAAVNKGGYDRIFHLYCVITLSDGYKFRYEKNEYVTITPNPQPKNVKNTESIPVPLNGKKITLFEFFGKTLEAMGDNFWKYSAFGFNCQHQQNMLLKSNNLLSQPIDEFIFQEPKGILQELPGYTNSLFDALTDLGHIFQKIRGNGVGGDDEGVPRRRRGGDLDSNIYNNIKESFWYNGAKHMIALINEKIDKAKKQEGSANFKAEVDMLQDFKYPMTAQQYQQKHGTTPEVYMKIKLDGPQWELDALEDPKSQINHRLKLEAQRQADLKQAEVYAKMTPEQREQRKKDNVKMFQNMVQEESANLLYKYSKELKDEAIKVAKELVKKIPEGGDKISKVLEGTDKAADMFADKVMKLSTDVSQDALDERMKNRINELNQKASGLDFYKIEQRIKSDENKHLTIAKVKEYIKEIDPTATKALIDRFIKQQKTELTGKGIGPGSKRKHGQGVLDWLSNLWSAFKEEWNYADKRENARVNNPNVMTLYDK